MNNTDTNETDFRPLHANRLRRIVRHLLKGKLAHKTFDFRHVNADPDDTTVRDHCGTAGCALGEFHRIFPTHFRNRFWVGAETAARFLGISEDESQHLFVPMCQFPETPSLNHDASRTEVAANMIQFLRSKGYRYND